MFIFFYSTVTMIRIRVPYCLLFILFCIFLTACGSEPQFEAEETAVPEWNSEEQIYRIQADETGVYVANESDLFYYPFSGESGWTALGLFSDFKENNQVHDFLLLGNSSIIAATVGEIPLWRTDDFGQNWYPLGNNLHLESVTSLAITPDHDTLYAHSSGMVARSADGGENWNLLLENGSGWFLRMNPENRDQLWSLGSTLTGQKYLARSSNKGENWETLDTSLQANVAWDIIFNPSDPGSMLLATTGNSNISRSDDSGDSWNTVFQENMIHALANSITEPGRVYAAGWGHESGNLSLLISDDFGTTWTAKGVDYGSELITIEDIAVTLIDGVENVFLATQRNGVFRYSDDEFAPVE